MANYKIKSVAPRADSMVSLDVEVYPTDSETPAGHFTVLLKANAVIAAFKLSTADRNAAMIALFEDDLRIAGIVVAEEAAALMDDAYDWPVVIDL